MKSILRQKILKLREELPDSLRQKYNRAIEDNLPDISGNVAGYYPINAEVKIVSSTYNLLPVIDGKQIYFADAKNSLKQNKMGIYEPVGGEIIIPNIVITPLVAFDENCQRIGYGGGYYDRYFAQHPDIIKIGVAYELQKADLTSLIESHDIALDFIATEETLYERCN